MAQAKTAKAEFWKAGHMISILIGGIAGWLLLLITSPKEQSDIYIARKWAAYGLAIATLATFSQLFTNSNTADAIARWAIVSVACYLGGFLLGAIWKNVKSVAFSKVVSSCKHASSKFIRDGKWKKSEGIFRVEGSDLQGAREINLSSEDEHFYEIVALEISSNNIRPGVWARALADSDGYDNKTQSRYIQLRMSQLQTEQNDRQTKDISTTQNSIFEKTKSESRDSVSMTTETTEGLDQLAPQSLELKESEQANNSRMKVSTTSTSLSASILAILLTLSMLVSFAPIDAVGTPSLFFIVPGMEWLVAGFVGFVFLIFLCFKLIRGDIISFGISCNLWYLLLAIFGSSTAAGAVTATVSMMLFEAGALLTRHFYKR